MHPSLIYRYLYLYNEKTIRRLFLLIAITFEGNTFCFMTFIWHDTIITAHTDAICMTMIVLVKFTSMDIT